jgi:hypothetical protein
VKDPVSSLVWQRSVRAVVVLGEEDAAGRPDEPAGVAAVDVPAATPPVDPIDAGELGAELVAAVTEPEKEHADNARTAITTAGTGRAARESEIVMDPR